MAEPRAKLIEVPRPPDFLISDFIKHCSCHFYCFTSSTNSASHIRRSTKYLANHVSDQAHFAPRSPRHWEGDRPPIARHSRQPGIMLERAQSMRSVKRYDHLLHSLVSIESASLNTRREAYSDISTANKDSSSASNLSHLSTTMRRLAQASRSRFPCPL